jgi:hypothetical protein
MFKTRGIREETAACRELQAAVFLSKSFIEKKYRYF